MSEKMMALGSYRFAIDSSAYQTLTRNQSYRWVSQERLGARPARQFIGPGDDTIELSGVIYPSFAGGLGQLDRLREEANKGEALSLIDGLGFTWGKWVILSIQEEATFFFPNGSPQKQTFTMSLNHYG